MGILSTPPPTVTRNNVKGVADVVSCFRVRKGIALGDYSVKNDHGGNVDGYRRDEEGEGWEGG